MGNTNGLMMKGSVGEDPTGRERLQRSRESSFLQSTPIDADYEYRAYVPMQCVVRAAVRAAPPPHHQQLALLLRSLLGHPKTSNIL